MSFEDHKEYEVETIVDKRYDSDDESPLYLVKWIGYSSAKNTWQPLNNLMGSPQVEEMVRKIDEEEKLKRKNWGTEKTQDDLKIKFRRKFTQKDESEYPFIQNTQKDKNTQRQKTKNKKSSKTFKILKIETFEDPKFNEQKKHLCVMESGQKIPLDIMRLLAPQSVLSLYESMQK